MSGKSTVVTREMGDPLSWGECVPAVIYTAINRQGRGLPLAGTAFPVFDGKTNVWHQSAHEGGRNARWGNGLRVKANMSLGAYEMFEGRGHACGSRVADVCRSTSCFAIAFKDPLDRPYRPSGYQAVSAASSNAQRAGLSAR